MTVVDDLLAAVLGSENAAREAHDTGTCKDSEWSCSHCEGNR